MYMAPITRAKAVTARPALRRAVGVPVLALAAVVAVPWLALNALYAGAMLGGRLAVEAADYAGQVALGR
jgi:hypothetical protein